MRFSAAAVALFAGLAVALPGGDIETIYQTEEVTITSCAPTVTDCPGSSVPATATTTGAPEPSGSSPVIPEPEVPEVQVPSSSSAPVVPPVVPTSSAPVAPPAVTESTSVIAVTTCIPTVTYSTITVTGPATTSSKPVIPVPGVPTGSATPSPSAPAFTGAANAVTNSFGLAGAAAVAALFLA